MNCSPNDFTLEEHMLSAANKFKAIGRDGFISDPLTDLKKRDIEKTGIDYILNSENFRSDEFINNHKALHVLFAGCSNTFGEGIEYEKTWAKRLYEEICKEESCTGYFNLGASGASIFETLVNVNRYIRKYSMPNVIFLLFPEIERDTRYFINPQIVMTSIIAEMYNQLELLCKQSGTTLISTSWLNMDEEKISKDYSNKYYEYLDVKTKNNKYTETSYYNFLLGVDPYEELRLLENYTETFKVLKETDISHHTYDYYLHNKKRHVFVAPDSAGHHGEGFHYAWFKYFYERYKNEKNNI
jgi:hypothetical protein